MRAQTRTQEKPRKRSATPAIKPKPHPQLLIPPKRGAPSTYTDEIGREICAYISTGRSLAEWVREVGEKKKPRMYYATIVDWRLKFPHFADIYTRAQLDGACAVADQADDLKQQMLDGLITPEQYRAALDGIKWSAGQRNPFKYGTKVGVQMAGDVTVRHVETLDPRALSLEQRDALRGILEALAVSPGLTQPLIEGEAREVLGDET